MQLDDRDRRLLAALGTGPRSVATLGAYLDRPVRELSIRLDVLAENGLVDRRPDGRFERTESGRRVLVAHATGDIDERIDTSPAVEDTLESSDLRPDEREAVRRAFAFLRFWGEVSEAEIVDAIYSEVPAGRDAPEVWWEEVVGNYLERLPGVEPPSSHTETWRYAGTAPEQEGVPDGRRVLTTRHSRAGDVTYALDALDLEEGERAAVRAAFTYLYDHQEVRPEDLQSNVYPAHPAGYETADSWWTALVRDVFENLPGVEREDGDCWLHRAGE